ADKAAPARARIARASARVLREAPEVLPGLLGVPAELRDAPVRAEPDGAAATVFVRLDRDVDAEVRPTHVGPEDARVVRAGRPAIVEGDRDRAPGADRDRGLELVRRHARRVDVVVDDRRRRPGEAAVRRLRVLNVHLAPRGGPVLEREV